jgi:CheY-like chemotaxis protein/signal transduction histidine kinase/CHASE3 domain sensor protein
MFKYSFKQQVLTGFAISLLFVFISAFFSYLSIRSLTESSRWVDHTYEVINTAERAKTELINAETGLRGFILTQKDSYKIPYTNSINQISRYVNKLKELVEDNSIQRLKLDSIELYAGLKVEDMEKIMANANSSDFETARKDILTNKGQVYKSNFLRITDNFINTEYKLLQKRKRETNKNTDQTIIIVLSSSLLIFALILFLLNYIRRTFDQQKEIERQILLNNNELAQLSALNEHNNWLLSGAAEINEALQGQQEIDVLSEQIVTKISNYINASIGALFLLDEKKQILSLTGTYAYQSKSKVFHLGEGLVGQAAVEKKIKLIKDVPKDYIKVNSALGSTSPNFLLFVPITFEHKTIAVIELGFLFQPHDNTLQFIGNIIENIGIALNSALAHLQLRELFEHTQQQSEELESQQEELRTTNEELFHKTEELQVSEEELRVQQEELQQTNAELEEKAQLLEEQNAIINEAKEAIGLKAQELELSSKYKSQFLANMSHELRTPLNSILILARILKENKHSNLSDEQIKYAGVIQNAGNDLLTLINDILDLSKIETGNIDLHLEKINPAHIRNNLESLFSELANHKKIDFQFKLADDLPKDFVSDQGRLEQILKNLLSNAFKFTPENGKIKIEIDLVKSSIAKSASLAASKENILSFRVSDTGIGIATDKQKVIFEAFKQEDGSTSRKYGGTGLGLSISRELSSLLGGEIQIESEQGIGSIFTLLIPQNLVIETVEEMDLEPQLKNEQLLNQPTSFSENQHIVPHSNLLLIIEDDADFAEILKSYAIDKGFDPILAHTGDQGLEMATNLLPSAIILDVMLPIMDGWAVLKKLKANPETKHIPVHMMSADNGQENKAKKDGAIGFLKKPIEQNKLDEAFELLSGNQQYPFKNVLVVEDQVLQNNDLKEQLTQKGINVSQAFTGKEALLLLEDHHFDCIILDLKLPDISGFELLDKIKSLEKFSKIPIIINTAMELSREEGHHIMQYSEAMVLKTDKSNHRLLDEVSLFIHKLQKPAKGVDTYVNNQLTKNKRVGTLEKALRNKTILITDDDMRNIFALSSALQPFEINILIASNGLEALEKIEAHPEIDLIVMDIMMPEMDGYEAMREIRKQKQYANLPIIALTAKAMKNDREKCIEAGANDYISKPIDVDKLLSMLRVWLS